MNNIHVIKTSCCVKKKIWDASVIEKNPWNNVIGFIGSAGNIHSQRTLQKNDKNGTCFHCEEPWCMAACPTDAIKKRKEDGIVYVEAQLCVGCKACIDAFPWKVPQWDESIGKILKCDYCRNRIDADEKPACVKACTAHALSFGGPNKGTRKTRQDYAKSWREKRGGYNSPAPVIVTS